MRDRLYVAAVLAGVAAMAVLAVFVLGPGRTERIDPSPPWLTKEPNVSIPGEILYVDPHDCIIRLVPSTNTRENVYCGGPSLNDVSWLDNTTVFYGAWSGGRSGWFELDLTTGRIATSETLPQRQPPAPTSVNGERVEFASDGSVYVVAGRDSTTVLDYDGPKRRRPHFITWSPDGEWLILRSKDEFWVVSRDGKVQRTLATIREHSPYISWRIDGHGVLPQVKFFSPPP